MAEQAPRDRGPRGDEADAIHRHMSHREGQQLLLREIESLTGSLADLCRGPAGGLTQLVQAEFKEFQALGSRLQVGEAKFDLTSTAHSLRVARQLLEATVSGGRVGEDEISELLHTLRTWRSVFEPQLADCLWNMRSAALSLLAWTLALTGAWVAYAILARGFPACVFLGIELFLGCTTGHYMHVTYAVGLRRGFVAGVLVQTTVLPAAWICLRCLGGYVRFPQAWSLLAWLLGLFLAGMLLSIAVQSWTYPRRR